ncbi:hypothetical protein Aperf_G00000008132 [Anoplocephala perfoliata]
MYGNPITICDLNHRYEMDVFMKTVSDSTIPQSQTNVIELGKCIFSKSLSLLFYLATEKHINLISSIVLNDSTGHDHVAASSAQPSCVQLVNFNACTSHKSYSGSMALSSKPFRSTFILENWKIPELQSCRTTPFTPKTSQRRKLKLSSRVTDTAHDVVKLRTGGTKVENRVVQLAVLRRDGTISEQEFPKNPPTSLEAPISPQDSEL